MEERQLASLHHGKEQLRLQVSYCESPGLVPKWQRIIPMNQKKKEHKTSPVKCFKEIKNTVLRIILQTNYNLK